MIQVIDFSGRIVDELIRGTRKAGEYQERWNTETLNPGVYFLRIQVKQVITKRLL